ncbi:uncharacterized protein CTRU02_203488 [Colletotrichum truncatum]|uniref:Uncharacterized protein n=1 Tax=Colletotrichum truncatum TaxID=5467 RepID=A0ACC3Z9Q1_COLTU|nr:uncharacterized protein CTRU02_05871 [Colletotrichum truncatum]KAF6793616.1 hypothetical protein CTRU02_05871 [Colletotrichum truncatum]
MATLVDHPKGVDNNIPLPEYSPAEGLQLAELTPSTSTSSLPPTYDDATASVSSAVVARDAYASGSLPPTTTTGFTPTVQFQIETTGKQWLSLPTGTPPVPIPVYRVEAGSWTEQSTPAYVSLRFSRKDSSCHLMHGDDQSQMPVCTTLYRFGPGKPPVFRLPRENSSGSASAGSPLSSPLPNTEDQAFHADTSKAEEPSVEKNELDLPIVSKSLTSRTQVLKTPHGTFQWRYASREERATVEGADSLLVCELVQKVSPEGGRKPEEKTRKIAQLVRGEGTRSQGSGRSTAGNGGRLMIDLFRWTDLKDGGREVVEHLVVASCICMLKKEVDRRRMQQMMILGMGATGF